MVNIIDAGANLGDFGISLAKRNPKASIHLIEPFSDLSKHLRKVCEENALSNVVIHEIALAPVNTKTVLNISRSGDFGTTSLLTFDREKINNDPYWTIRTDLVHESKQEVDTLSLKSFIENQSLDKIDFIKIDIQGIDLEVLASAGDRLANIQAGMLEVSATDVNKLYIGEQQNLRHALNFLDESGFTVMAIKPNDPATNEVNIFFTRNPETWKEDIASMKLEGLPAFDGKHYWHAYSGSPIYSDENNQRLVSENQRLLARINVLDQEIRRLEEHISLLGKANNDFST